MASEIFTVVALPHSRAADAPFHVSLFVSPRLTPDDAEGELGDFTWFPRWATLLHGGAPIELRDQLGPIEVSAELGPIDEALWDAVFPPDTPVRGPQSPDWSNRHWRTFRAGELHDAAKVLHVAAMVLGPTSPLPPDDHPFTGLIEQLGGGAEGRRGYDERRLTRRFDAALGEGSAITDPMSLDSIERHIAAAAPVERLLLEVHRARRFYDRPETQSTYRDRPIPGAQLDRPPRPGPDFHERCSLVGDHPALQRLLGLVVDLRAADPDRLARSEWLSARIAPDGDPSGCRVTRTRCHAVGTALVTVALGPEWRNGRLRLGDDELFGVLDMDPDGSALKLDRFLLTLPRLAASARNGDPVHAAPTALRSIGFTVVRDQQALRTRDAMARQRGVGAEVESSHQPFLFTEDVTHGMRVEVWDDTTRAWYSLHQRLIDVAALAHGDVVDDGPEEGFIQGTSATQSATTANSPVHVHEAMFGWDGWSLAAPKPGMRVRHDDGDEIVEDPEAGDPDQPTPVTPLRIVTRVAPGTLPRLRYGRSYAFRVWAADLAGNSRPHAIGPVPVPAPPLVAAATSALAGVAARSTRAAAVVPELRARAASTLRRAREEALGRLVETAAPRPVDRPALGPLDRLALEPRLRDTLLDQVRARRAGNASAGPRRTNGRAAAVASAFADAALDERQPFLVGTSVRDAAVVAAGIGALEPTFDLALALDEIDTVSPLVPFLRWDPVGPPAVVSRQPYTAGESLRQVVIRSGVAQDPTTLAITVTPPDAYAAAHGALGYRATSERHLVPPKTSQTGAELHGLFDAAIGSVDPDDHRRLLGVALRESGTLFDVAVPRLDDPTQRFPQPGIALLHGPDTPVAELKTLPLALGDAPFPGQYVVHDTDQLRLPYLPDALARGVSLVFQEAGRDRAISFPFGTEGFTARYEGDEWPELRPFRLVLHGSPTLDGQLEGSSLRIGLPAGDGQRFRLSSALDPADLDLLGLWRVLPPVVRANNDVVEAAADGWLWAFTPFDDITLVHAVPRPLEAPRSTMLLPFRTAGSTAINFVGALDVHGPSTESVTAECRWADPVDDLSLDHWHEVSQRGVAFTTPVGPSEDIVVLLGEEGDDTTVTEVPGYGPIVSHRAVHLIGDTRHHTVRYRFRATTRFREYFDPSELAPAPLPDDPATAADDGRSVVGPELTVDVPSSARPAAPVIHSVLPLFRWDEGTEPEQPVAVRRRRRAGVRIYLERPWFSSGDDELVGVLLAPGGNDVELGDLVSQWGSDPVWRSAPVERRGVLGIDNLMRASGLDDRPGDAAPVLPPATLPLTAVAGSPNVVVLGYRPLYQVDRHLWYVDIALDPGSTFWPFVRLSLVRYQPHSIPGCHLSKPALCDFVQLTPERTTSVSRTDVRHVRVVVSGPIGVRQPPPGATSEHFPTSTADLDAWLRQNRKVVARLQRRDPDIPTDLGWETVASTELVVRGHGRNAFEAAWVGALESPIDLALRRPGESTDWRVTVEEWERLPGDPADLADEHLGPVWEQRIVYADEIAL
jgi:hypothetical protein